MPYSRKNIKDSKNVFRQFSTKEYEKIFFCEISGGFLICHRLHGALEKNQNIFTGKMLAQNGKCVILLKAIKKEKAPDALIDTDYWEFKLIRKAKTNISNAVQNHFLRAALNGGQAPNIVLHIDQDFIPGSLLSGLEHSMKADKNQYFQKVLLVYKGRLELLYRREIHFGKAKRKILRLVKN